MINIIDKLDKYQPIKRINNKYIINWGLNKNDDEYGSWYYKVYDSFPAKTTIKNDIENFINQQTQNAIKNNFVWNNMQIDLSFENQMNYKLLFDITVLQEGKNLPEQIKFKINNKIVYYSFETIEEFKDFIIAMNTHIRKMLINGWERKENIDYSVFTL